MKITNKLFIKLSSKKIFIREDVQKLCKYWGNNCPDWDLFIYTFYFPVPDVVYQVSAKLISGEDEFAYAKITMDALKVDTGEVNAIDLDFTVKIDDRKKNSLFDAIALYVEGSLWDDYQYALTDTNERVSYVETQLPIFPLLIGHDEN